MAEDLKPVLPTVVSQEGALVGDENLPGPEDQNVEVEQRQDDAQVPGTPQKPVDKVEVFEVVVETDKPILDPSSPLAVQVPDAGRGSLLLPIHQHINSRRVDDIFAEEAGEHEEPTSDEDRAQAAAEGTTPRAKAASEKS